MNDGAIWRERLSIPDGTLSLTDSGSALLPLCVEGLYCGHPFTSSIWLRKGEFKYPDWRQAYQAAMAETDLSSLQVKILEAEAATNIRQEQLADGVG